MAGPQLLVIDDEPNILTSTRRALELEDFRVEVAGSGRIALEKLGERPVDLVLLDVVMPEQDGLAVLEQIRERYPDVTVIMMSGNATIETAVRATKLGAHDFVEKPLSTDKLLITIQNALSFEKLRREHAELRARAAADLEMIGKSSKITAIHDAIRVTAPTSGRVLITGENGTGKELVARALHEGSRRAEGPFVKLNCAAIPAELIESELFGHEKGSFTGATQMRRGKFELADGGTLFLDEIGDMAPSAQAKVLRVLQEGELERVGGAETLRVDVRVIAATNKDLPAEISEGRFREDLYYRLNVVPLEVPPLRERRAEHFARRSCTENDRRQKRIDDDAMTLLMQHAWPGNVRELRNLVERLVILTGDRPGVTAEDVRAALPSVKAARGSYRRGIALKDLVAAAERDILLEALADNEHHVANTARELQLERSHLYKKLRAHGIQPR
jgi:DNA-binding NtrC family response regulator